jgi:hypothetical protein
MWYVYKEHHFFIEKLEQIRCNGNEEESLSKQKKEIIHSHYVLNDLQTCSWILSVMGL